MSIRRPARRVVSALTAAGLVGALLAVGAPASAVGPFRVTFTPAESQTIEYGQEWGITATHDFWYAGLTTARFIYDDNRVWKDGLSNSSTYYTGWYDGAQPLPVGTHRFTIQVGENQNGGVASPDSPLEITVAPASLSVQTQAIEDPSSEGGIILSARLTGTFVDDLVPLQYRIPANASMPAGIWELTVVDQAGAVAFTTALPGAIDGDTAASAYWADPAPDTDYTVTASFTPDTASAGNFLMNAGTFDFSTPARADAPVVDETPAPIATETQAGIPLPLWAIIAIAAGVVLVLIAAVIVLVRSRGRTPSSDETEPAAQREEVDVDA